MKDEIFEMVVELLRQIAIEKQNGDLETISLGTRLFGAQGTLDSLDLVNFIVDLEQEINDRFNKDVVLADDRAMSQRHSPFRTVGSMIDHIARLIGAEV